MLSLEVNREFDVEFGADISMDLDVDSNVDIKNTHVAWTPSSGVPPDAPIVDNFRAYAPTDASRSPTESFYYKAGII